MLAADPLEGTPYRTIGKLGEGAMGLVLEAEHRMLRTVVCVKVIRAAVLTHSPAPIQRQLLDRMRLEAQALAALDGHENLLQIRDYGETPTGAPFLVTERLVGRTLAEHIKDQGAFAPADAVAVACQILDGLGHAHAHGIVHRDVKPANIFLTHSRTGSLLVKVLDFGVAKIVDAAAPNTPSPLAIPTEEGFAIGTPRFYSPEQALAKPIGPAADLYAVGGVLYMMLVGRGPFDAFARGALEMSRAHVERVPLAPSAVAGRPIPASLDREVLRALEKDPARRHASASSMADALKAALTENVRAAHALTLRDRRPLIATELLPVPEAPHAQKSPRTQGTEIIQLPEPSMPAIDDKTVATPASLATPERIPWASLVLVLCATIAFVIAMGVLILVLSGRG